LEDFKKCLKNGKIRINKDALLRINREIEIAEKFLNSAIKNTKIEENEMSVIASYNSIFHTCRALLFKKGYIEKSHFCLIIALKHLYREDKKISEFLNKIDKVRISRHQIQYRGDSSSKEESKFVYELGREFLKQVKTNLNLLKKTNIS